MKQIALIALAVIFWPLTLFIVAVLTIGVLTDKDSSNTEEAP